MKWEVRKIVNPGGKGKWGVYLMQKYCKTDEPVCYVACYTKKQAKESVDRMNKRESIIEESEDE
jgi:hypothetical protein